MSHTSGIEHLVRRNIRALKAYSSARDEAPGETLGQRIMLDANENSFGGPLTADYSRYPDPQQQELKRALADLKEVDPAQIFIGNGSDEAIDLLFRAFVEPGQDNVIILPPTYGMYSVQANIHGAEVRFAPLSPDFMPVSEAVRAVMDARSKLLFLCSPNNPTGACLPADFILEMLNEFPGIVVVDEAYQDFSETQSWVSRIGEFPNLVVLQTLSKAWGLAGLRIGMAYGNVFTINVLSKIKYPYNLNSVTMQLGLDALTQSASVSQIVAQIIQERGQLERKLPFVEGVVQVFPSEGNFLLVRVIDADAWYTYLAQNGVVVRNRSREMHCENCLRITVGRPQENKRLLELMTSFSKV